MSEIGSEMEKINIARQNAENLTIWTRFELLHRDEKEKRVTIENPTELKMTVIEDKKGQIKDTEN